MSRDKLPGQKLVWRSDRSTTYSSVRRDGGHSKIQELTLPRGEPVTAGPHRKTIALLQRHRSRRGANTGCIMPTTWSYTGTKIVRPRPLNTECGCKNKPYTQRRESGHVRAAKRQSLNRRTKGATGRREEEAVGAASRHGPRDEKVWSGTRGM